MISETNGDTEIIMEVSKYTDCIEREMTIKNTQSGTFSIQYSPSAGKIHIDLTDANGESILSANEKAKTTRSVVEVKEGKGTYHLTVDMKEFTGSFHITWEIAQTEAKKVEPTKEPEVSEEKQVVFQSDFGYTISYEKDQVDYRKTTGYDQFVLKSDDLDAPFVFVSISRIEAKRVDLVKEAALSNDIETCVIGKAMLSGECSENKEVWDGGETIHKTYMLQLKSGDALLIETQWYTEQADSACAT